MAGEKRNPNYQPKVKGVSKHAPIPEGDAASRAIETAIIVQRFTEGTSQEVTKTTQETDRNSQQEPR